MNLHGFVLKSTSVSRSLVASLASSRLHFRSAASLTSQHTTCGSSQLAHVGSCWLFTPASRLHSLKQSWLRGQWPRKEDYFPLPRGGAIHFHDCCRECSCAGKASLHRQAHSCVASKTANVRDSSVQAIHSVLHESNVDSDSVGCQTCSSLHLMPFEEKHSCHVRIRQSTECCVLLFNTDTRMHTHPKGNASPDFTLFRFGLSRIKHIRPLSPRSTT